MCYGLDPLVSPEAVAMKVIEGIYDGVSTSDLDNLAAEVAAAKTIDHRIMHYWLRVLRFQTCIKKPKKHFLM